MELGWRTAVLLVTGIPALIAAIMVLLNAREILASRFFLAVVFAWVWHTVPYIIGFSGAYQAYPWLTFFPFNTELWIGPLWLLTVRALTSESLPHRWWLWLSPGLVQTLYYSACFLLIGPEWGTGEGAAAMKFSFNDSVHLPFVLPVETIVGVSLMAFAAWDSWRRIARYRDWSAREHSNAERVDLRWLQEAAGAILALAIMWFAVDAVAAMLGGLSYPTNFYFYAVSGAVVLWLSLQFLARSDRRFPKPGAQAFEIPSDAETGEVEKPAIPDRLALEAVETKVREGGWHFDQDLTLGELARRLGTNSSTLSAALNAREEVNFTSFINGLRVEAICDHLRSSKSGATLNLLDLALDCGFGSKATFNRAFKRHTGLSPREWIERQRKSAAA